MESPIQIKDMVSLRQEAIRIAVNVLECEHLTPDEFIDYARNFAAYIKGDANLPEYYGPVQQYGENLEKFLNANEARTSVPGEQE